MYTADFRRCLDVVQKWEGGWADHPRDPGGATMYGITKRTYEDYLGRDCTKEELRNIPKEHVEDIYFERYWEAVRGGDLPEGVDLHVFDFGVNAGPRRAKRYLQRVIGVKDDGIIGPITLRRLYNSHIAGIIEEYGVRRERYYRDLPHFNTFGKGWLRRNDDVTRRALRFAREAAHNDDG